jgi:ankyrin repeat protein
MEAGGANGRTAQSDPGKTKVKRRTRYFLLLLLLPAIPVAACALWVRSARCQYALDRQLIEALMKRNAEQALALVNTGADPNTLYQPTPIPALPQLIKGLFHRSLAPTNESPTAFMLACGDLCDLGGYFEMPLSRMLALQLIEAMLRHGAKIDVQDSDGKTPLIWASSRIGNDTLLKALIKHGANVNTSDKEGKTPLIWAVESHDSKMVRVLLEHGANINAQRKDRGTALGCLVMNAGHRLDRESADIAGMLFSYGANPNLPDQSGFTLLQVAEGTNRLALAALLKRHGAKGGKQSILGHITYQSPDHTLVATVLSLQQFNKYGGPPSRIEIRAAGGRLLASRDHSFYPNQGYTVEKTEWTADSQFFVYNVSQSGGHSPWHNPVFFYSRKRNRFYSLDTALGALGHGSGTVTGDIELRGRSTLLTKAQYFGKSRKGLRSNVESWQEGVDRGLTIDLRWLESHLTRSAISSDQNDREMDDE